MSIQRFAVVVGIGALAVCSFYVGSWYSGSAAPRQTNSDKAGILHYACPMHPQYRSDKPGDCLSCGMRLEPVYADGRIGGGDEAGGIPAPGAVQVTADKQQVVGVRAVAVRKSTSAHVIRTSGRVVPDERLVYRVNSALDGWIRKVYQDTTGSIVQKDQRLATIYSTMYRNSLQSFLISLAHLDTARDGLKESPAQVAAVERSVQLARDGLRNMGMGEPQIEEITRTREQTEDLHLYSPATGFVLLRNVAEGQRIVNGDKLYEIADVGRVWVLADLFEQEGRYVRAGRRVKVSYQGREYDATVSEVLPQFDEQSRTLKVRLEMDNPDYMFRPGMFVEVEFPVELPAAIAVPVDAVIDSGLKKTVYVAKGDGYFEPRQVETGWRMGDQVEIVKGLMPGEQVVVSGNFLLDSESRMRMTGEQGTKPIESPEAKTIDPVCGMEVDPAKAVGRSEYQGKTYYFCSDYCKREFDQNPEAVLKKGKKD